MTFGPAPAAGGGDVHDRDLVQARRRRFDGDDRGGGVIAVPLVTKGTAETVDGDNKDINYFLGIDASGGCWPPISKTPSTAATTRSSV